jgi:putative ABC transport system permease protein
MYSLGLPAYLALKEIWRNKGRFLLVSLVIALITLLVLFISALGEGLATANREYLSKLDASLLVYHDKTDYIIGASHLDRSLLSSIRQVAGVAEAGQIGFANADILTPGVIPGAAAPLKVSLIGVEPGRPGLPPLLQGRTFYSRLASEAILDRSAALRSGLKIGDTLTIRVSQGTKDQIYTLRVVGITDGEQYQFQPSIFVPFFTWDQVRPKSDAEINSTTLVSNLIAVRLKDPGQLATVQKQIVSEVSGVEVATISQAILAVPGYTAQQSTIQTQGFFTMFIGLLVIGGFFQIQALQKVAQIGVLKAIGASNHVVGAAAIIQIILITAIGVGLGGFFTYLLSLSFPPTVPIVFNGQRTMISIAALLLTGPVGGYVSIRYATRIEPLKALGLSQ